MDVDGQRSGARDNGLRCAGYTPVADLDPRIVDALLTTLRDEGIAAYAMPTPGATGGAMETRMPSRPIDRLWVDDTRVPRAKELIDRESRQMPTHESAVADPDFETAWQQVLTSLQSTPGSAAPSWPEEEERGFDSGGRDAGGLDNGGLEAGGGPGPRDYELASYDPADEDHFDPPPPPPLPRPRKVTIGAVSCIVFGLLILAFDVDGGTLTVPAVLAIVGGVASLVWNMRQGPPTDSGWDDGAVV